MERLILRGIGLLGIVTCPVILYLNYLQNPSGHWWLQIVGFLLAIYIFRGASKTKQEDK